MRKPEIVPGTAAAVHALGERLPRGARVLVGELDGRPLGLVGIYPERGRLIMFATLTPEAKHWKREILHAARSMIAQVAHLQAPIHARADPQIPGSARLLEHLGFRHLREDTYGRMP